MNMESLCRHGLRARPLIAATVLGFLALALATQTKAQYAGVYSGTFNGPGGTGVVSVLVRDENIADGIWFDGIIQRGGYLSFLINPDGSFTFPVPLDGVATGQLSGTSLAGTYDSGLGTFFAAKSPGTGFFAAHGGFYTGFLQGSGTLVGGVPVSVEGQIYAVVDALGQTMLYAGYNLFINSNLENFLEIGGPAKISDTGNLSVILLDGTVVQGQIDLVSHTGAGTFTIQIQGQDISGTWDLSRFAPLPTAPIAPDVDVTGLTDMSGDAVADVAGLSQLAGGRPRVRYYSGAARDQVSQVNYLSTLWTGIAAATLADSNQDGVRNDPAVAVLGQNIETGKLFVQVRTAASGASIAGMRFLSAAWTPVDVVIIDDVNGDGVSNDTAIGVLGINPNGSFRRRNILQVRDLAEGNVITNIYFANGSFTPLAAGTVPRSGKSPLLAVLVEKTSTKAMLVQARVLGDGSLQRNTNFLSTNWRGKDLAILQDTNGNSVFNDASYAALAHNPGNNKNVVQIRRPGGAFVKNIFVLTANWQARRMGRSEDIGGNLFEELGVLGNRFSNGEALIQLKDASTGVTLGTISP